MSPHQDGAKAVLIVTRALDDHVDLVEPELRARGAQVIRLDTERFEHDRALVRLGGGGAGVSATVAGVPGERIGAVWWRFLHEPAAEHVVPGAPRELARSEMRAALEGTLLALDARWVNHPHANARARHKPLQLALAARTGFEVPETRVTADPAEIRALFDAWDGELVAKLVGGQVVADRAEDQHMVFTTLLEPSDLADDDALAACPALYQRRVPKACELRATVIGDTVLTCRIDSQATDDGQVDWRHAVSSGVGLEPHELDADVAARCVALARTLDLRFAGIDLIVTPDGRHVFVELNAAGTWAWAQRSGGLPIGAALADELLAA